MSAPRRTERRRRRSSGRSAARARRRRRNEGRRMSGEWLVLAAPRLVVTFLIVLALALLATGWALRRLRTRAILDRPNERSSHAVPTPRGGGIGILAALLPAWLAIVLLGYSDAVPIVAAAGALVLAALSWRDDIGGPSPAPPPPAPRVAPAPAPA